MKFNHEDVIHALDGVSKYITCDLGAAECRSRIELRWFY